MAPPVRSVHIAAISVATRGGAHGRRTERMTTMTLDQEQYDLLVDVMQLYEEQPDHRKLSAWDKKFLADHKTRFDEHGEGMMLSRPQQTQLQRLFYKLKNCIGPNV